MKRIKLTQGKYAIVDDEDYDWLNQWKWCAQKTKYGGYLAVRGCRCPFTKHIHTILMHRQIISCPKNMDVDHINHKTLDNTKNNLRICNRAQNRRNSKIMNKYKGITWHNQARQWMAQITVNYKHIYLGIFKNEIDAAKAYDKAAKKYHGEYAYLNFRN